MPHLLKSMAAGRTLTQMEVEALRVELAVHDGPNKPQIDKFLLSSDTLKSRYHIKKYTTPLAGGLKATPNGTVELREPKE
jgi:hypothetical protein